MQTVTVTVTRRASADAYDFATLGGKIIATIRTDYDSPARYRANFGPYGAGKSHYRFADALEHISGCIERKFAELGLGVTFSNE